MNNVLSDNWVLSGTNIDDFNDEIKNLDERTFIKECQMKDLNFVDVSEDRTLSLLSPLANFEDPNNNFYTDQAEMEYDFFKDKYDDDVIHQMIENAFALTDDVLFNKTQDITPISVHAMPSIKTRVKISGYGFDNYKHVRNLCIVPNFKKEEKINVILRKDMDITLPSGDHPSKVFAIMSDQYSYIPQNIMTTIYNRLSREGKEDGLGEVVCTNWKIANDVTNLYLEFPDSSKKINETYEKVEKLNLDLSVGILLEASDIGYSSFKINGYVKNNDTNSIIRLGKEYKQVHRGEIALSEAVNVIRNEIFPEFSYVPERLAELLSIDIAKDKDEKTKVKTISNLYNKLIKYMDLNSIMGKKRMKSLTDTLIAGINPTENYTAYDIATQMMNVCDLVEEKETVLDSFSRNAILALKFDYKEFLSE